MSWFCDHDYHIISKDVLRNEAAQDLLRKIKSGAGGTLMELINSSRPMLVVFFKCSKCNHVYKDTSEL